MVAERMVEEATRRLAEFVATADYAGLPAAARRQAGLITADTVGVALAGSLQPEMQELYGRLPRGRGATMLRAGLSEADPATAAFANATAACFLEMDEGCWPAVHPAVHVIPSALAFAQFAGRSGPDYLAAVILGYEVVARLRCACRGLRSPLHPHGNLGHAGAVAALGRLSGWSADQLFHGMNVAAGLALASSYQPCLVGATVRNVYAGMTAQTAFTVKMLVESGFTGYEAALGETFGEILGVGFDPEALTDGLGLPFYVTRSYIKFHASCARTHSLLDALADALGPLRRVGAYPPLTATVRPEPEQVRRVRVRLAGDSMRLAVLARPNQLSAKFSIPYAVAVYLVRGSADPDSFRGSFLNDRRVRELAARVEVVGEPTFRNDGPAELASEVEIELADGSLLRGSCSSPFGTTDSPPTLEDVRAKFRFLTTGVLPEAEQEALWAAALDLENLADMGRFPPLPRRSA